MAEYVEPLTAYAPKDSMSTGNPEKLVKGEDFTNEFEAIVDGFATEKAARIAADDAITARLDAETEAVIKNGNQFFQTTYWDGAQWVPSAQVKIIQDNNVNLNKFEVSIDCRFKHNNIFGSNNDDVQFFNGDCYIGYPENVPNNNDTELGTLFLGRGVIVGRPGVGETKPVASIGMEDNVIFDLGDPYSPQHAVNLRTLNAAVAASFRTLLKETLNTATSFEEFKSLVSMSFETLETAELNDE